MNNMTSVIYVRDVVGYVPYWASDITLKDTKNRFKRVSGKFPSKNATWTIFYGEYEKIGEISVNDLGDISYPKGVIKILI